MPEQVILEDACIDFCYWSVAGGSLRYDIIHLHPDWGFLVQSYRVDTQDFDGRYIYTSEFILFKKGEAILSNFSSYPREDKPTL